MSPSPVRLGRVTGRASFDALRRTPHRARSGSISLAWLPAAEGDPDVRVAFAVGRSAGNAVTRNRVRRRLRAACAELAARGALPAGTYLTRAGEDVAAMPWTDLCGRLAGLVTRATGPERP